MDKTDKQREAVDLIGSAAHSLLWGGRRAGKSVIYCRSLVIRSNWRKSKHVIFRQHFKDVKAAIGMETMPFVLKPFSDEGLKIKLNKTDWFWEFVNGSQIWLGGLDEKERTEKLLGMEWSTEMFNEASQMNYDSVETALSGLAEKSGLNPRAYYDCNPPLKSHWLYKLFLQHVHPVSNTPVDPKMYMSLQMNPVHNLHNLADGYIKNTLDHLSERKRRRFRDGEFLDEVEGALWNSNMISAHRVKPEDVPDLVRVVTGVDPSGSTTGDAVGIVGAGMDVRGHIYVLKDYSLHGTPLQWGTAVVACHKDINGDRIIGEKNFGGDMVESTLRNVDQSIPYKGVTASRGKVIRAEPVAALYEQGMVHHVGQFPDMEDEQCSYTGEKGEASPNILDALVHAITELCGGTINPSVFAVQDTRWPIEKRIDASIDDLYDQCSPREKMELDALLKESGS